MCKGHYRQSNGIHSLMFCCSYAGEFRAFRSLCFFCCCEYRITDGRMTDTYEHRLGRETAIHSSFGI